MKSLSSKEIRRVFLDFFEKNKHKLIEGSSVIPKNDPSLLYINSGMAPLKNYFLGLEDPPTPRLTNVQPCIRTNDIEDIGDRHHLTFFEMMGSWSIGDYYKEEAITLAFDLLVNHFGFDKNKLYATVYKGDPKLNIDPDHESVKYWEKVGLDKTHIILLGKDNFWGPAGETGPCGPCTEVFYDTGESYGPEYTPGGYFDDKNRYIEIWNAGVFMELNKTINGGFEQLDMKSVDTGSGVERMYLALNGIDSLYEVDTIKPVYQKVTTLFSSDRLSEKDYRTLTDHIRTTTMILSDGVIPSRDGRGYIPRRLIRKSVALAIRAKKDPGLILDVSKEVMAQMEGFYPKVKENSSKTLGTIENEIESFTPIIQEGISLLDAKLDELNGNDLDSMLVFNMVATHGVPLEIIADHMSNRGVKLDEAAYWEQFRKHQDISKGEKENLNDKLIKQLNIHPTTFTGYDAIQSTSRVSHFFRDGEEVREVSEGQSIELIAEKTPFYAESGGQVGDRGAGVTDTGELEIIDTQKTNSVIIHSCNVKRGVLKIGQDIELTVESSKREMIRRNHSATHLLHSSLRKVLGDHIEQRGSLVNDEKLRFDFSHDKKLSNEEIALVEQNVNQWIRENHKLEIKNMDFDSAIKSGAMALFKEKYDDVVRVVQMGDVSTELCGGIHVSETTDIDVFLITKETSISKGIRRVEGITWKRAYESIASSRKILKEAAEILASKPEELLESIVKLKEKSTKPAKQQASDSKPDSDLAILDEKTIDLPSSKKLYFARVNGDKSQIRAILDKRMKSKEADIILMLDSNTGYVIIGVSESLREDLPANKLIQEILSSLGGKGGGHSHLAQGGIKEMSRLDDIENLAIEKISAQILMDSES